MWTGLVELVRAAIFVAAHLVGGSLGGAVILVSAGVRLALLPLSLRAARQARANEAKGEALRPEIARLEARYRSDPARLMTETLALHRKHGVTMFGRAGLASFVVQAPLLGALFTAVRNGLGAGVRFLWIRDLSRVDGILLAAVTGLSALAASVAPSTPGSQLTPRVFAFAAAAATLAFLWAAPSTVALSVGAGSAVSALQNWLIRREVQRSASPPTVDQAIR